MNVTTTKKNWPFPLWLLTSLIAGYVQAVSIAAPWNGQPVWWLQMLSLASLLMLIDRAATVGQAALLGWLFATSWLCGTVWWLFISMHVYGGLAAPLAVLAVFALCGFLALYYTAACYFYKRFRQFARMNAACSAIIFASLWMLAELARDSWFTGFPWGAVGYAQVQGPLAGYATWLGVYGVGCVAAWLAAILVQIMGCGRISRVLILAVLVLPSVAQMEQSWSERFSQRQAVAQVALLQGNIPQGEKFDTTTGVKTALDWYQQQLNINTNTLVISPETALPLLPRQLPEGYWDTIQKRYATGSQAALIGIPLGDFDSGYTNSVVGLKPGQTQPYQYDKHHLVPFGEFIPPLFKWFTQMMNIPLGDFKRGAIDQRSFEWANQRWGINICYEDLFGDELARRFVDDSLAPTVLVNVSNIGWFGNTIAIDQHLQISRMRALELGRPMIRATNTGATVIINHRGEVTHSLPRHTRDVLMGSVEGRQGLTPFARWASVLGLWPLWIFGITIIFIASYLAYMRGSIKK